MTEAMLYASKIEITNASLSTQIFEFVQCGVIASQELISDDEGVRGERGMQLERAAIGRTMVSGTIKMQPTPVEMAFMWPLAMGGSTMTDLLSDITLVMDLQTKANTFIGRINKLRMSARPGQPLDLEADFIGYGAAYGTMVGSGAVISGIGDLTNSRYTCQQSGTGLTIGATAYLFDEFDFELNNNISATYMNGAFATDLMGTTREVTLSARFKYTSTEQGLL